LRFSLETFGNGEQLLTATKRMSKIQEDTGVIEGLVGFAGRATIFLEPIYFCLLLVIYYGAPPHPISSATESLWCNDIGKS
jgi:hypothetical protein